MPLSQGSAVAATVYEVLVIEDVRAAMEVTLTSQFFCPRMAASEGGTPLLFAAVREMVTFTAGGVKLPAVNVLVALSHLPQVMVMVGCTPLPGSTGLLADND